MGHFLGKLPHQICVPNIHYHVDHLDYLDYLGSIQKSADPLIMLRMPHLQPSQTPSIVEIHIFEAQCQDCDSAGSHLLPG